MDDKIILIFVFFILGFFLIYTKRLSRETFYSRALILEVLVSILICYAFFFNEKQTDISTENTVATDVYTERQQKLEAFSGTTEKVKGLENGQIVTIRCRLISYIGENNYIFQDIEEGIFSVKLEPNSKFDWNQISKNQWIDLTAKVESGDNPIITKFNLLLWWLFPEQEKVLVGISAFPVKDDEVRR